MEAFVEILFKRKITFLDRLSLVCWIFIVILLTVVSVCLSRFVFALLPFLVVLDFFVIYYIILYKRVEFEYIIVGDEMDVDKILGEKKRKRLVTIKRSKIISFGIVKDEGYIECRKQSFRVIKAASDRLNEENYYVLLNDDDKKTLVILERDERLLKVIKR